MVDAILEVACHGLCKMSGGSSDPVQEPVQDVGTHSSLERWEFL